MVLPSRSKVFAVLSLVIAMILISINVISCVGDIHSDPAAGSVKDGPTSLQKDKVVNDSLPFDFNQLLVDQNQFSH